MSWVTDVTIVAAVWFIGVVLHTTPSVALNVDDPNVCTNNETYLQTVSVSYQESYTYVYYTTCTDITNWFKCTRRRTNYRAAYKTEVRNGTRAIVECCPGYIHTGEDCLDNNPPIITCPQVLQEDIEPGQTSTNVSSDAVTATDAEGPVLITYFPNNVNIGQTTVFAVALDAAGNTASCVFVVIATVNVDDNNPPIITCPRVLQEDIEPGQTSTNVSSDAVTATDAEGPVLITYFPNNVNIGQTTVFAVALDAAGNTACCVFVVIATVNVVDNNPPIITCPQVLLEDIEPGQNSTAVSSDAVTAIDAEGPVLITYFPNNVNIGQTTVFAFATDAARNTAYCVFVVDATVDGAFSMSDDSTMM